MHTHSPPFSIICLTTLYSSPSSFLLLFPPPSPLLLSHSQLDVCRRNCLIYSVFKDLLNQNLTEAQCQAICTTSVRLSNTCMHTYVCTYARMYVRTYCVQQFLCWFMIYFNCYYQFACVYWLTVPVCPSTAPTTVMLERLCHWKQDFWIANRYTPGVQLRGDGWRVFEGVHLR